MPGLERSGLIDDDRARVLAVDDDPQFLVLLHEIVDATRHLAIAGEARSGERAVREAHDMEPDMILMDVRMTGLDGIAAGRLIKADRPATLVILISTTHPDELPPVAGAADAVIWKIRLAPRLLDETWLQHRRREP
jgi:DNA-binding NarL/FixJ family response regulator